MTSGERSAGNNVNHARVLSDPEAAVRLGQLPASARITFLIYLGNCYAWGWRPSVEGLIAFLRQQQTGRRDRTGRIIWPE